MHFFCVFGPLFSKEEHMGYYNHLINSPVHSYVQNVHRYYIFSPMYTLGL